MEFSRQLNQSRRRRTHDSSEIRIVDLSVYRRRAVKLAMVKHIEGLHPYIERIKFPQPERFTYLHIEVVNTRAVKDAPGRVTELPQSFR